MKTNLTFHLYFYFFFSGDSAMAEASAEKKRPASAASNKEDSSDEKSEKSSRRSVTPEPAKKKKKIDPVRLFFSLLVVVRHHLKLFPRFFKKDKTFLLFVERSNILQRITMGSICHFKKMEENLLKLQIKFIYSEKATKFCGISTNYLSYVLPVK